MEKKMNIREEYAVKYGLQEVIDDMGKIRESRIDFIIFPNGWAASIVENVRKSMKEKYSVAMCDHNGHFDWSILDKYGAYHGNFFCNTDLEIIVACETIRRLQRR